jgi:sRNA-binding regulator protein Hfq
MGYLQGLQEYLDEKYHLSVFDTALSSKEPWDFHLHNHSIICARIVENRTYELEIESDDEVGRILPKTNVKFLYPTSSGAAVKPLIKTERKVKSLKLEPIPSPRNRYHIKNKSLFPLLRERKVILVTLLEGEIMRGIIADFSRYDITMKLKGGVPVTILRHAVYDLRDKRGRCFLKNFQEAHRDWEKSSLYVPSPPVN